jgi:hypothetical protein
MPLSRAQIEAAISYNQVHALDVLPAIERELGRAVPLPGKGQWHDGAVEFLAKMQRRAKLDVDGQFGPASRMALCDRLPCYPTFGLWAAAGDDEREHWTSICEIMGHELTQGRDTLIGLRGVAIGAPFTHPSASRPAYDDTFIWLGADGSLRRFAGATHPYQARSENMGDDIDGDNRSDIATIRPGRYVAKNRHYFHGRVALDVYNLEGTNHLPTYRDLDGDRAIGDAEMAHSLQPTHGAQVNEHGAYARGVKFHPGWDCSHSEGRFSSVGCQTAPLGEIERLYRAKEFDFVLLDAVDVLMHLGRLE